MTELKEIPGSQNDPIKAIQNLPGWRGRRLEPGKSSCKGIGTGRYAGLCRWGADSARLSLWRDSFDDQRRVCHRRKLSTGAYGADYGRGLGGVIEVATRRLKVIAGTDRSRWTRIDGNVTVEGPVTKPYVALGGRIVVGFGVFCRFLTAAIRSFRRSIGTISFRRTTGRAATTWICLSLARDEQHHRQSRRPRSQQRHPHRQQVVFLARLALYASLFQRLGVLAFAVFGRRYLHGRDRAQGLDGQPVNLRVLQLGYNLRSELRQQVGSHIDYALGLDFEGAGAGGNGDALAPGAGDSQGLPVGGADMVKDAGRSENGFFGDAFFSDSNGPALRRL